MFEEYMEFVQKFNVLGLNTMPDQSFRTMLFNLEQQGEIIRFAKEVAKRAEKVQFHPSQKVSHGRNGSLVMELRCRGHRELIWELMHPRQRLWTSEGGLVIWLKGIAQLMN